VIKVTLNKSGVRNLLRSAAIQRDIADRAARIAAAAGDGVASDSRLGRNRAHATALTTTHEAMKAEAEDQVLTRAIDAGR